jgi:hypothetical protein
MLCGKCYKKREELNAWGSERLSGQKMMLELNLKE